MISLLHYNLNDYDANILNKIMEKTKYPAYEIVDIKDNDSFSFEGKNLDNIILINDETKSISVFDKAMNNLYGNNTWKDSIVNRINKPSTFLKDSKLLEETWKLITDKCNVIHKKLNPSLLNNGLDGYFEKMKNATSSVIIKNEDNIELELRPDNFKPTIPYSLTYTELVVIMAAKQTFKFDELEIKSYE